MSHHMYLYVYCKTNYMFKNIQNTSSKHSVQSKKVYSWNKIDTDKYISEMESIIPKGELDNVEKSQDRLTACLKTAAEKAVPSKTYKLKGPKFRVSEKVLKSMQTVKQTYREWAAAGKPRSGKLFYENKMAKKVSTITATKRGACETEVVL